MKKLFILAPAMLLTAMIYSAAPSTVKVTLSEGAQGLRHIEIPVDLNTETFPNLLQKIYNNKTYLDYTGGKGEITSLALMKEGRLTGETSEHINDQSMLRDAGVRNGAHFFALISTTAPSSKVTVALSKGAQGLRRIEIPVNLNTETFPSLIQKIYNNKAYRDYAGEKGKITSLALMKGAGASEHTNDPSKLRDAGAGNGAYFVVDISE